MFSKLLHRARDCAGCQGSREEKDKKDFLRAFSLYSDLVLKCDAREVLPHTTYIQLRGALQRRGNDPSGEGAL